MIIVAIAMPMIITRDHSKIGKKKVASEQTSMAIIFDLFLVNATFAYLSGATKYLLVHF